MRGLTDAEVLDVWERGQRVHPLERPLVALAVALGVAHDALTRASLAARDAALFELRRRTIGDDVRAQVRCPNCGDALEFETTVSAIAPTLPDDALSRGEAANEFVFGDATLRLRPANTADLVAVSALGDVGRAREALVRRCVVGESPDSAALVESASEQLTANETTLDVTCPTCGHRWAAAFDIGAFFWHEVAARARRLLREVHALARAYGWTEREVLALSSARRQSYIELIEAGARA